MNNTRKLLNLKVDHIKRYEDMFFVTIPKSESSPQSTFTITGTFFNIVDKYADLRPENTKDNRFFVHYHQGRCTIQPMGRNKFLDMPRKIAKYLKLPESKRYTGNIFESNTETKNIFFSINF